MARLVPLGLFGNAPVPRLLAGYMGLYVLGSMALCAQTATPPYTNAPAGKPPAAAASTAKPSTSHASPALPSSVQNTLGRYGNIVSPSDQTPYPFKLRLPNPTEGEVRVPKQDDLLKREKLEALAELSDDQIRKQLAAWPAYSRMSLRDQASMLQRIQDFRDYHFHVAMQKAHDMGLLTLTPPQLAKFERAYWDQRLKLDEDLAKQFEPLYQAREQKMNDALLSEFAPATPAPQPPAPKPVPARKPALTLAQTPPTNAPPIAQAQH